MQGETVSQVDPARRRPIALTLLTRSYCHLCDDMRAALMPIVAVHGAVLTEFDVDAEPALETRYGDLVPVLLLGDVRDGVELCHYHLDAGLLEGALRRASAP